MIEYSLIPYFVCNTFNYSFYDDQGRDLWEIVRHYYPSIKCFVFDKKALSYIDEEAIIFSGFAGFIKKSTIMKYGREKQEGKIFIRREFFVQNDEDIDTVDESYFEDAVKIRDIDEKIRKENLDLKFEYTKETMYEITEGEYERLLKKEKWDSEDVQKFTIIWKDKFGDDWIENTAYEFYTIRKEHTRNKNNKEKSD